MNAKNLLLLASLAFAMPLSAQSPLEDFKRDITLSGSNWLIVVLRSSLLLLPRDISLSI